MAKAKDATAEAKKIVQRTGQYYYANGKRKTSIAKVRLYTKGTGDISINNRPMEGYFFGTLIGNVLSPLKLVSLEKAFDITVKVTGGGISSQADAVRHGISRGLITFDPELRPVLKKAGLLTRDSRIKERKKFGLKRARRAPQWAKR